MLYYQVDFALRNFIVWRSSLPIRRHLPLMHKHVREIYQVGLICESSLNRLYHLLLSYLSPAYLAEVEYYPHFQCIL
jgi:hypothetical protein